MRAGQHLVRAPAVLTVQSRGNVTIIAEPNAFVSLPSPAKLN